MREYLIETKRVGFSYWNNEDFALAKLLWGNDEVAKYIVAKGTFSETEIEERLVKEIDNQARYGVQYYPIFCLETNDFIGCCGLRPYSLDTGIYEIGFHLLPAYWGMGYAKEVAVAMISYAFDALKATDIFARHNPNNVASAKVLTKLGFHYVNDKFYEPTGLYHPTYRYQKFLLTSKKDSAMIEKTNR
jgi:RimJ/RimL family protein N-acetyltransferase